MPSTLACEQALRGVLAAGREKEGHLPLIKPLEFESTSNSPVAPRRLSCQISANHGETERRANIDKHWKTFAKGHDVITNVISTNQHFASTFFDAETKLQALLPFPASPPERPGELARAMERNVNEEI